MAINISTIIVLASLSPHQSLQLGHIAHTNDLVTPVHTPDLHHCPYLKLSSLSPLQTHITVPIPLTLSHSETHIVPIPDSCHCPYPRLTSLSLSQTHIIVPIPDTLSIAQSHVIVPIPDSCNCPTRDSIAFHMLVLKKVSYLFLSIVAVTRVYHVEV